MLVLQSGTEAPDRPVLFVEATPDPTPATPTPNTGPSTRSRASYSPRAAATVPTPAAVPNQASSTAGTSGGGLNPAPPPLQQALDRPPPGMPLRDWIKQKKRSTAAAGGSPAFPSVQVYCPCGSAALDLKQPPAPVTGQRPQSEAAHECSSQGAASSHAHGNSQLQPASQHQTADRYIPVLNTADLPLESPSNKPQHPK